MTTSQADINTNSNNTTAGISSNNVTSGINGVERGGGSSANSGVVGTSTKTLNNNISSHNNIGKFKKNYVKLLVTL